MSTTNIITSNYWDVTVGRLSTQKRTLTYSFPRDILFSRDIFLHRNATEIFVFTNTSNSEMRASDSNLRSTSSYEAEVYIPLGHSDRFNANILLDKNVSKKKNKTVVTSAVCPSNRPSHSSADWSSERVRRHWDTWRPPSARRNAAAASRSCTPCPGHMCCICRHLHRKYSVTGNITDKWTQIFR